MHYALLAMDKLVIWFFVTIGISYTQSTNIIEGEYCTGDKFEAECLNDQVIIMRNATYGRMKVGHCILENYRMGCEMNVIHIIDRLCSGKHKCSFFVAPVLENYNPCTKGLAAYLESTYVCVKVNNLSKKACTTDTEHLGHRPIFHLSNDVEEAACFRQTPSWHLQANPGEIIEITMMDFTQAPENPTSCPVLGYIVENVVRTNKTICASTERRETLVYRSVGHEVNVMILPEIGRGNAGLFGMQYKARGCKEKYIQSTAYYRRDGDIAEIGCSPGDTRWRLECIDREWKGQIGNCTTGGDGGDSTSTINGFVSIFQDVHESIIIAIVIGIAVLLSIIVLVCGIVYISKHRNHKDMVSETYAHGPRRTDDEFKMYGPEARPEETVKRTPLVYHNTNDRGDMYPTMIDKRDMYPINDDANEVCSCASYSSIPRLDGKRDIKEEQIYLDPTASAQIVDS